MSSLQNSLGYVKEPLILPNISNAPITPRQTKFKLSSFFIEFIQHFLFLMIKLLITSHWKSGWYWLCLYLCPECIGGWVCICCGLLFKATSTCQSSICLFVIQKNVSDKEKGNNIPKTCRGRVSACLFVLLPIVTEKGYLLFFKITFAWKILC